MRGVIIHPEREADIWYNDQVFALCKNLARKHEEIKLEIGGLPAQESLDILKSMGYSAACAFGVILTATSAGTLSLIGAPIAAVGGYKAMTSTREIFRPELKLKRLAYEILGERLGIETFTGQDKFLPIAGTKSAKDLRDLKTLVRIGKGKIDRSYISEVSADFIEKCGTGLEAILENISQADRLLESPRAIDREADTYLHELDVAERAKNGSENYVDLLQDFSSDEEEKSR